MRRDREVRELLAKEGWRIATVWECSLKRPAQVSTAADLIAAWLSNSTANIEIGEATLDVP
jgi:DNA mismatch endonuclease, patch repair protein